MAVRSLPWPGASGQPDPGVGVSPFSRNENRPGFSGLVGKGSSSRRSGGWGRRRGEGREERKEGREDGRGREARVCRAPLLLGLPSGSVPGRCSSRAGRGAGRTRLLRLRSGSPPRRAGRALGTGGGLGGMGRREPLLRQPQPPRRWDPVTRVPPPRRDLSLATPPRLGQFHL